MALNVLRGFSFIEMQLYDFSDILLKTSKSNTFDFVLRMHEKYNCSFGSNVNLVYVLCFKEIFFYKIGIKLNDNNKIAIIVENDHILYYRYGMRNLNDIPHGIPQT